MRQPSSNTFPVGLSLLVGFLFAAGAPRATAAVVTRGPYLQTGTPTSVIVRWRTDAPTDSQVRYGPNITELTLAANDAEVTTEHEVPLTGLLPDTRYYYSVGSAAEVLAGGEEYFFLTSPLGAKPTRIWVLGDSGTANSNAAAVRDAYYSFADARHTDLWLMLGDNAYPSGTDPQYQEAVFDMYPEMLRQSVLWPTIGNHDTAFSYDPPPTLPYFNLFSLPQAAEAGGFASGTEKYYSFNYGNIHFVCLDSMSSDRSSGGPMCQWLLEDLAASTNDWLIAFWHHPPYTKGSHNSDTEFELVEMRENVLPILESYGVDLVLAGHSHCYERSFLLDGHYGHSSTLTPGMKLDGGSGRPGESGAYFKPGAGPTPNQGAVYVVAGSSGQITHAGKLDHPAMFISLLELGSLVLDIDGDSLHAKFLKPDGSVPDSFTILKGDDPRGPRIVAVQVTPTFVSLTWTSTPGQLYRVERTPAFGPPDWRPASGLLVATGSRTSWTGGRLAGVSASYYRIACFPPPESNGD